VYRGIEETIGADGQGMQTGADGFSANRPNRHDAEHSHSCNGILTSIALRLG